MDRIKKEVLKSIDRFKKTGKLPKDYDVISNAPPEGEDETPNYIENVPEKEPFTSEDAEILAENMTAFLGGLTHPQKRVYDFHIVGGLTLTEVSRILGVTVQTIAAHVDKIRARASCIISSAKYR